MYKYLLIILLIGFRQQSVFANYVKGAPLAECNSLASERVSSNSALSGNFTIRYPRSQFDPIRCEWTIDGAANQKIKLYIESVSLPGRNRAGGCTVRGLLELGSWDADARKTIDKELCGLVATPIVYWPNSNRIWIKVLIVFDDGSRDGLQRYSGVELRYFFLNTSESALSPKQVNILICVLIVVMVTIIVTLSICVKNRKAIQQKFCSPSEDVASVDNEDWRISEGESMESVAIDTSNQSKRRKLQRQGPEGNSLDSYHFDDVTLTSVLDHLYETLNEMRPAAVTGFRRKNTSSGSSTGRDQKPPPYPSARRNSSSTTSIVTLNNLYETLSTLRQIKRRREGATGSGGGSSRSSSKRGAGTAAVNRSNVYDGVTRRKASSDWSVDCNNNNSGNQNGRYLDVPSSKARRQSRDRTYMSLCNLTYIPNGENSYTKTDDVTTATRRSNHPSTNSDVSTRDMCVQTPLAFEHVICSCKECKGQGRTEVNEATAATVTDDLDVDGKPNASADNSTQTRDIIVDSWDDLTGRGRLASLCSISASLVRNGNKPTYHSTPAEFLSVQANIPHILVNDCPVADEDDCSRVSPITVSRVSPIACLTEEFKTIQQNNGK
ncbi:uncharacterized protein LOC141910408 [Tubulanus polymorphus]|uniref:uncharacterized protein LOC141910408 n=1 Tax=Tubulanus polymorphus TaxID=672921 RepID=UPI003DA3644D